MTAQTQSLQRQITRGGAAILLINLAGGVAAYGMFALLAQVMTTADYGGFSAGFALATLLAQLAIFGQSLLILRNLPRVAADDVTTVGRAAVRVGHLRVMIGAAIAVAGILVGYALMGADYLLGAAALVPALAFADYQMHALRGRGLIWRAFLPRELVWRGLVALTVGIVFLRGAQIGSAQTALFLAAGLLVLMVLLQSVMDPAISPWRRLSGPFLWRDNMRTSAELWFTSTITMAMPQLSVLVVGLFLSLQEAALFFAAAKTAQILKVFPAAMIKVSAPLLSAAFHKNDMKRMQDISRIVSVCATGAILCVFAVLALVGPILLGLFGEAFVAAYPVLLIMAGGYLISGICGPTRAVMLMTDNQNALNRIVLVTNVVAILALPIMALAFGMIGVAIAFAVAVGGWNFWVKLWIWRNLSLETSILSLLHRTPV